jgi:membrane protease YdiL (CAAX protease family)
MTPRRWFHVLLGAVFVPVLSLPLLWGVAIHGLRRAREPDARRWAWRILALAVVDTLVVVAGAVVLAHQDDDVETVGGPVARAEDRVVIGVLPDVTFRGPGARIREVSADGPAASAGMQAGDVVLRVNGREIGGPDALRAAVRELEPGVAVPVEVERGPSTRSLLVTPRRSSEVPRSIPADFEPRAGTACLARPGLDAWLHVGIVLAVTAALAAAVRRRSALGSARGVWWAGLSVATAGVAAWAVPAGACALLGGRTAAELVFAVWGSTLALAATALVGRGLLGAVEPWAPTRAWPSAVGWGAWYILTGAVRLGVLLGAVALLATGRDPGASPVEWMTRGFVAGDRRLLLLLLAVPAIVLAPVGEEVAFRGLLQPELGRWLPTGGAIAVTSALFAAAHWPYGIRMPLVALVAAVLGWARAASGGLRAPIVLHALVNAVAFAAIVLVW